MCFEDEPKSLIPVFPHYILALAEQSITVIRIIDGAVIQKLEISPFVESSMTLKKVQKSTTGDAGYMLLQGILSLSLALPQPPLHFDPTSPVVEGSMVKVWKKRWFVLNGGVLFYFNDDKVFTFGIYYLPARTNSPDHFEIFIFIFVF